MSPIGGISFPLLNITAIHSSRYDFKSFLQSSILMPFITVGLYDTEGKVSITLPKTPEEAVWAFLWKRQTNVYRGSRPDALNAYDTREWAEEVGAQLAARTLDIEYEEAVRDQKKELREFKKREKLQEPLPQLPQIELTPANEEREEDLSQSKGERSEPIEAQ